MKTARAIHTPQASRKKASAILQLERRLIWEGIEERYGIDLKNFSPPDLEEALRHVKQDMKLKSYAGLQNRILRDPAVIDSLLERLNTPSDVQQKVLNSFCGIFNKQIIPFLKTYPKIKIWQFGCGDGRVSRKIWEALEKGGLTGRSHLYITGFTDLEVASAMASRYRIKDTAKASYFRFNYLSDTSFNEFQVIIVLSKLGGLCETGIERVRGLIDTSLVRLGFLGTFDAACISKSVLGSLYTAVGEDAGWFQRGR